MNFLIRSSLSLHCRLEQTGWICNVVWHVSTVSISKQPWEQCCVLMALLMTPQLRLVIVSIVFLPLCQQKWCGWQLKDWWQRKTWNIHVERTIQNTTSMWNFRTGEVGYQVFCIFYGCFAGSCYINSLDCLFFQCTPDFPKFVGPSDITDTF